MKQQTNLEDLPASGNKEFWDEAEVHTNIVPEDIYPTKIHYFVRRSGHEAQCTHCEWGFVLDAGDKVIEGHLYNKQGTLII